MFSAQPHGTPISCYQPTSPIRHNHFLVVVNQKEFWVSQLDYHLCPLWLSASKPHGFLCYVITKDSLFHYQQSFLVIISHKASWVSHLGYQSCFPPLKFSKSHAEGRIQGLKLTLDGAENTHQQFVDDTMLHDIPTVREARAIKQILNDFAMAAGIEVSLNKSKVFFFNTNIAI